MGVATYNYDPQKHNTFSTNSKISQAKKILLLMKLNQMTRLKAEAKVERPCSKSQYLDVAVGAKTIFKHCLN